MLMLIRNFLLFLMTFIKILYLIVYTEYLFNNMLLKRNLFEYIKTILFISTNYVDCLENKNDI